MRILYIHTSQHVDKVLYKLIRFPIQHRTPHSHNTDSELCCCIVGCTIQYVTKLNYRNLACACDIQLMDYN